MNSLIARRALFSTTAAIAGAGLLSSAAKANTVFTGYAYPTPTGTANRTTPARFDDSVNILEKGAKGDYSQDDAPALLAAITEACGRGHTSQGAFAGCAVIIPPGVYRLDSEINLDSFGNGSFTIEGIGGPECCVLVGNHQDWIIRKANVGPTNFRGTRNIYYKSLGSTLTAHATISDAPVSGALMMRGCPRAWVEKCLINGVSGIDMSENNFGNSIRDTMLACGLSNFPDGSIGIYGAQIDIKNVRCEGWGTAMQFYNVAPDIGGASSAEGCAEAIVLGRRRDGSSSNVSGGRITSFQTERCSKGLTIVQAANMDITGLVFTGTAGPGYTIDTASWSSAGGGTATITMDSDLTDLDAGWTTNGYTRTVSTEGLVSANSGSPDFFTYDKNNVTGTRTGAKTFTIAVANDPGTYISGGLGSRACRRGIVWQVGENIGFHDFGIGVGEIGIDLSQNNAGGGASFRNVRSGNGWLAPPAGARSIFTYDERCDTDNGFTTLTASTGLPATVIDVDIRLFTELPGQAGATYPVGGAVKRMKFFIRDAAKSGGGTLTSTEFGTTVQGGGSQFAEVGYNGTNWTLMRL